MNITQIYYYTQETEVSLSGCLLVLIPFIFTPLKSYHFSLCMCHLCSTDISYCIFYSKWLNMVSSSSVKGNSKSVDFCLEIISTLFPTCLLYILAKDMLMQMFGGSVYSLAVDWRLQFLICLQIYIYTSRFTSFKSCNHVRK